MKREGPMFVCIRSGRDKGCHTITPGDHPDVERQLEQWRALADDSRKALSISDKKGHARLLLAAQTHAHEQLRGDPRVADWIFENRRAPTDDERAAIVVAPNKGAKILKFGADP